MINLRPGATLEDVRAEAHRHCPQCGARDDRDDGAAAAAYAVMRPEYGNLVRLKALRDG